MYPLGYSYSPASQYAQLKAKAKVAVSAIQKVWAYSTGIPYAYGVELRPGKRKELGFLLPEDQIKPSGI